MSIIRKLFSKKKDVPSLEKYLEDVKRVSKQADDLHRKAVRAYNDQIQKKGGE